MRTNGYESDGRESVALTVESEETSGAAPMRGRRRISLKMLVAMITALAVIVSAVVFIPRLGGDHEDRAEQYAKAYYTADYRGIKKGLPYDVDQMFYDMVWTRSQQEGSSWAAACDEFGQDRTDFGEDSGSMLKTLCKATYKEMREDSNGTYWVRTTAIHSIPMSKDEIAAFVQSNNEAYASYGVRLEEYMAVSRLRKAYRVDVRVVQKYWEDRDPDEWLEEYVVVRYKGQWKVLTIFNPDMY